MRAIEIIKSVDALEPNLYGIDRKLAWLSELDGQIYAEIGSCFEPCREEPGRYVTGEEELLVPFPFGEMYRSFLKAMIAMENFETAKYNENIELFDSLYGQYRDGLLRTERHVNRGKRFLF